ncbi:MAG: beta strand repeat-containing protein, partial [Arcobacter sp.]
VTTTIIDDAQPNTPNDPSDGVEPDMDSVTVKLVATDAAGNIIDPVTIAEGEIAYYKAILVDPDGNQIVTASGNVDITFTDGTAIRTGTSANGGQDFTGTNATVALNTVFSAVANDDYVSDSGETFNVQITDDTYTNASAYENVIHDITPVITTIIDNAQPNTPNDPSDGVEPDMDSVTVRLVALDGSGNIITDANGNYVMANEVAEGEVASYMAILVDPSGNRITTASGNVTVEYNDGTAKVADLDYDATKTQVVALNSVITKETLDDYIADNGETFTIKIQDDTYTNASAYENVIHDETPVTTTIIDNPSNVKQPTDENNIDDFTNGSYDKNDTVYVKIIDNSSVVEGKELVHYIQLVDKDGNAVIIPDGEEITVTLTYSTTTGTIDSSDFKDGSNEYAENNTITVTLDKNTLVENGIYKLAITNTSKDDFTEEGDEVYNLTITDLSQANGTFENIAIGDSSGSYTSVTGTIKDGVIVGAAAVAKVYEDALVDDIKDTDTSNPLISGEGVSSALISEATLNITNPNNDTYSVEFKDYNDANVSGDFPTLYSEGQAVSIAINSSGVLIGTRTDGEEVFSVAFDKTDATKYTVTLSQPIDHTTGNDGYDLLNIPIEYIVSSDGSSIEKTMNITVVDSAPQLINETIVLNEDSNASSAGNTFILADEFVSGSGSSSLTLAGADISATNATVTIDEYGDDVTISGKTAVGTVTSNGDGSVSFVPVSNFSGTVTLDYTIIDFDGDIATTELTFEVTPIADAPTMQDNISLSTYEDNSWNGTSHNGDKVNIVALGLIVPTITDATDLTSGADDASERLSALTFKFANDNDIDFDGAVVKYDSNGDGTLDATLQTVNRGDSFTIMISDITDYHPNGTTATYSLTQAQYNSLAIIPEADNANNITFTISTESHEVQDNGDLYATDIVSATKTQTVDIDIKAVTDPVTLREDTSATNYDGTDDQVMNITIAEDTTLDLAALLVQTFGDNDSSESHYFDVSGLEPGTKITIGGTTRTADDSGNIDRVEFTGDDTTFKITPPADWDGTMTGIKLTLIAEDSDSDSTGVNQWETDSVTLNLTVTPVANDVVVVNPVSGEEDTAIALFVDAKGDLTIQTTDTAGTSEDSITGVKILTSSIVGTISGGTTTIDGLYTVFDVNTLADYKITPPAHSSSDITMKLIVKTTDGTSVLEHSEVDYKVTVTPVAEEVEIDSDGDGIDDVTMTADHTYALDAKEDSWFTLGTDTGFNLESNWSNEDDTDLTAGSHTTAQTNSEETFAHLTFTVSENGTYVEISGADYKYYNGSSYITVTDTGSGVDIPVAYLDTLEVLAPSQLSGDIRIEVQAKTVDYDEDTNAQVTSLSGLSYLTFTVDPVADIGIIQVAQSVGYEDAGRTTGNTSASGSLIDAAANGIDLDIKVSSDDKDGSETFNVQIDKIPDGGSLNVYDNSTKTWKLITISSDGTGVTIDGVSTSTSGNISVDTTADGTYKVTIIDYQNNQLAKFIPAHNDDTDYTFKVSSQTVDTSTTTVTGDYGTSKDLSVIVKNIADVAISNELKTDITANEDSQINLKDIYATPSTLASSDSSEELTIKIDLPDGFTIVSGSPYYIEDGLYAVNASDIIAGNIVIDIPDNFSGDTSFDLTYITTEKAGEGSSKTGITQTVNVFVNPIADDVTVSKSSTINEDADGSANKLSLTPTLTYTDGSESVTAVKILASSVPSAYTLYSDASMTTELTLDANGYYIVTDANSVYAKNTTEHKLDGNFDLTVVYTVTDTVGSQTDIKDFTHVHTVNVNAVTDTPTIALGTISETSGSVTVVGTNVTVNSENSQFTVPVTTTSEDADSSEVVTKIVISGVPQGVEVVGATYYGYAGSEDNGIWVLTSNSDTTLDSNGALSDVVFKVNTGADFEERDITITTYIQDGANAQVENDSTTIHIDKFLGTGTGAGTPADLELAVKDYDIKEDTEFSLGSVLAVSDKVGSSKLGSAIITISDLPEGSIVTGADYSYIDNGKTYYVVVGNGNAADMSTQLSDVLITTPKDMNTGGDIDGQFTFTATITSYDQDVYNNGNEVSSIQDIAPITDKMTITVDASNILEDDTSALTITLSNPNDGSKTELLEDSITVKISETWKDSNTNGEGTEGTLTDSSGTYNIVDNNDGTYTVTKINGSAFTLDTPITGLVYTPAENRDGDVIFEVSVKNKETGSTLELDSKGDKTITVSPVIDAVLDAAVSTTTGTEDVSLTIGTTKLENAVKLEIATGTIIDGSEKLGNVILDEVPTGFTVWYVNTSGTLVMATNVGTTDNLTNQWLITAKSDGSMPEVYINAPENWAGDFDFKAKFTLSEENLSTPETTIVNVTGHIDAVADGLTIDPTLTFGEAYSWVNLNLNANMVDVDGSETMSIKLTGLDDMAQFQLDNGTSLTSNATYNDLDSTWTIEGIQYDQINNVQFVNDTSSTVSVEAWTVDGSSESSHTNSETFDLSLTDVSGILTLNEGINLDFDKIENLSNIEEIDLSSTGANNILNLSLQDVIAMTDSSNTLKIIGNNEDSVSFTGTGWSKTVGAGADAGFDIYSNSNDSSVKVKVEQNVQDQII